MRSFSISATRSLLLIGLVVFLSIGGSRLFYDAIFANVDLFRKHTNSYRNGLYQARKRDRIEHDVAKPSSSANRHNRSELRTSNGTIDGIQSVGSWPVKAHQIGLPPDNGTLTTISAPKVNRSDTPLILSWHKWFSNSWYAFETLFQNCPRLQCAYTHDRSLFKESSAIVFRADYIDWRDLPPSRRSDQYFVFALLESPPHSHNDFLPRRRDFFNLSMTYRRDSDIVWPYGDFQPTSPTERNETNIDTKSLLRTVEGKTKLVAWFVSHCRTPSRREEFVRRLQQHAPVDVYGSCGPFSCPVERRERDTAAWDAGIRNADRCHRMLTRDYKFYLSLENSLCRDYVTEKFYKPMDTAIVVPIVLERNLVTDTVMDTETKKVLNESIIAVDDFPDVKAMANYLKYLDKNITAYMQYFEWRNGYQISNYEVKMGAKPGCELCRIIMEKNERKVKDIARWWFDYAKCHAYV